MATCNCARAGNAVHQYDLTGKTCVIFLIFFASYIRVFVSFSGGIKTRQFCKCLCTVFFRTETEYWYWVLLFFFIRWSLVKWRANRTYELRACDAFYVICGMLYWDRRNTHILRLSIPENAFFLTNSMHSSYRLNFCESTAIKFSDLLQFDRSHCNCFQINICILISQASVSY